MATISNANAQTYTMQTTLGDMKIKLYDNTPLHKANFEKLVEEQVYDSVLFHRVIKDFMIQGGDIHTKDPAYSDGTMIPAEFAAENFHKKGALAAARTGDFVNP
ncbi:MAG: peptidylprolyl isomerase, partial [Dysgonamonadaceae bacterium]|nr:peptidylprolyl isomerase [Dysgonamonadaceae bacterium]